MLGIKYNYLVKKRNVLNELRANSMTLQELRFFSIYLSKINPDNVNTRVVRFSISDFQSIMNLGRINLDYLKQVVNGLLCKVVYVPNGRGGYIGFQLFKECTIDVNNMGEWYIEIDAHDRALPLLFEFREKYFSYQLWNALRLKSSNQLRMFEILKQYEKIGVRILSIDEIKDFLGIDREEYQDYHDFKKRVLEACRQALAESTDIKFTYEPYGKRGKGGKIGFLKFTIEKNNDYVDQLTLGQFIDLNISSEYDEGEKKESIYDERMSFLAEACNNEFTVNEIIVLYNLMAECLPYDKLRGETDCYDYLKRKYDEMGMRDEKNKILHRFAYMKSIIGM